MKDFIVLIAILLVGIVIATIVFTFKGKMKTIGEAGTNALDGLTFDTN